MGSSEEFIFRSKTLQGSLCDALKHMRHKEEFCDITFRIGQRCISAHRVVIAAAIPYFRHALSSNDSLREETAIVLSNVDSEAFEQLIEFTYSGEISITATNVKSLLHGAWRLKIDEVCEACCDFLIDNLNPGNVLDIRNLACELNFQEMAENVDCYVEENFEAISQREEFLDYPLSLVEKLLGSSDLCISSEEKVFEALMKWIKKFPDERKEELPEQLRNVRMPLLTPCYLKDKVAKEDLIKDSLACRDLLDEARNFHFFPEDRPEFGSFSSFPRFFERICAREVEINKNQIHLLYASKVYECHSYSAERGFSAENNENVGTEAFPYQSGSSAELKGKIYHFTESGVLECVPSTNVFELCEWRSSPGRVFAGAITFNDKIYICGGRHGDSVSNAVNCYDPETDKWTDMKSMSVCRSSPSVSALWGAIYVLGGRDGTFAPLSSVERFNPRMKKWKSIASLLVARSSLSSASVKSKIYACGGTTITNGSPCHSTTVEVYDPVANQWTFVSPMNTARYRLKVLPLCGKLVAFGGEIDNNPQNVVEIYDPESDEWILERKTTKPECCIVAAAVA